MTLHWRDDDACDCGEPGCYATAEVLLPAEVDYGWIARVRRGMQRHRSGGVHSPQDPRRR